MNMHYTIFAFLLLSLFSAFSAGFARSLHSSGRLARLGSCSLGHCTDWDNAPKGRVCWNLAYGKSMPLVPVVLCAEGSGCLCSMVPADMQSCTCVVKCRSSTKKIRNGSSNRKLLDGFGIYRGWQRTCLPSSTCPHTPQPHLLGPPSGLRSTENSIVKHNHLAPVMSATDGAAFVLLGYRRTANYCSSWA